MHLQAQINPHFPARFAKSSRASPQAARHTAFHLSNIFRYFLQSDKVLIPLFQKLKIVRSYLEGRLRLGLRLQTVIQVDQEAEQILIPVLDRLPV